MHILTSDENGIKSAKKIIEEKGGHKVSEDETGNILGGLMRHLYLIRVLKESYEGKVERGEIKPSDRTGN